MNLKRLLPAVICIAPLLWAGSIADAQPTNPAAAKIVQNAQALIGQGKFTEAEKALRAGLAKHGKHPGINYFLGYALHAQKKYDDALAFYTKLKNHPNIKQNVLYNMACVYSMQGKKELAFASLDKAVAAGFKNFSHIQGDAELAALKKDPRFARYKPKWLSDDQLFVEPSRIIHKWVGETAGDQFRRSQKSVSGLP